MIKKSILKIFILAPASDPTDPTQNWAVLTLIHWIPDSQVRAGTLYPRGHCDTGTQGHRITDGPHPSPTALPGHRQTELLIDRLPAQLSAGKIEILYMLYQNTENRGTNWRSCSGFELVTNIKKRK